jgi:hypothetical protein
LFEDVIRKFLSWKQKDYEIVLVSDSNENVYKGRFSARLTKYDLQKTQARQKKAAIKCVNNLVSLLCKETCGKVEMDKPEDVY